VLSFQRAKNPGFFSFLDVSDVFCLALVVDVEASLLVVVTVGVADVWFDMIDESVGFSCGWRVGFFVEALFQRFRRRLWESKIIQTR
jgi:hypothetical protein